MASQGFTWRARLPLQNTPRNTFKYRGARTNKKKQIQRRAQRKIQNGTNKYKHTAKNTPRKTNPKSKTRDIQIRPKKQAAGGRSGQMREGFFARWRQADDGRVPTGAERSCWTHLRGRLEKGTIPLPESQTCVCPVMTSQDTRRVTRHRQCTRTRSWFGLVAAVHARTTGMPRAKCVDYHALAKHVQNVFRFLRFFSINVLVHTSTWARINAHHSIVPDVSCVCIFCFAGVDVSPTLPKFVAVEHN